VSRLNKPEILSEFSSLCLLLNLYPSEQLLKANVRQKSFALLCPRALSYRHELLSTGFSILRRLDIIDEKLIDEIQCNAKQYDLWSNTKILDKLSNQRTQVGYFTISVN